MVHDRRGADARREIDRGAPPPFRLPHNIRDINKIFFFLRKLCVSEKRVSAVLLEKFNVFGGGYLFCSESCCGVGDHLGIYDFYSGIFEKFRHFDEGKFGSS